MSIAGLRRAVADSVSGLPRQFWWLWTSTLVNRLGAFVATFLALYLTVERGYSASYAGLVGALYGLGGVVSSVVAGVLADRLGRRPTLLMAQLGTSASVALLGFMEHPVTIAVVAFLVGLTSNASRPAVQAMMADIVAPADRIRAYALNYWALNMGFAISATAAGLIAAHGYLALFLIESAMVLACALLIFFKLPESRPEPGQGEEADGDRGPERVSMLTVVRDGRFMTVVGLAFLLALILQQSSVALPVVMGQDGLSSTQYGLVAAVNGALIVLIQIPVTRFIEHRSPAMLLVGSALLTGYGFGLTAFAGSVALYAVTVAVWTLGEIINSPTQMGLVVRLSPTHGRGRYQGMFALSWTVASLVAPLISGTVIDRFGSDTLWAGCAVAGTVTALGYAVLLRRVGTSPDESDGGTEAGSSGASVVAARGSAAGDEAPVAAGRDGASVADGVAVAGTANGDAAAKAAHAAP
ncbi:MFS transporter [Streptomyces sp. NPDC003077]|uniref:MDR family MFS transporter n=1 Tax=Streptomyces sp. NPDC003077 TaxID=3154443 RepID=UPI0033A1BB00